MTNYFKDLVERAVSTFFQVLVTLAGVNQTAWINLDWVQIAVTSGIAAGLAVAKGLIAFKFTSAPTASFTDTYSYPVEP